MQKSLRVDKEDKFVDGNEHLGHAWSHPSWKDLLEKQDDAIDILRMNSHVQRGGSFRAKLKAFLACRSLQNLYFATCLHEWKEIQQVVETNSNRLALDPFFNAEILERYAILINRIQLSPPELMKGSNVGDAIVARLDRLAQDCRQVLEEGMRLEEQIARVKDFLVNEKGFVGNSDDYYNYRNSLLDCALETKKGIPITLAILFVCVFRRLGLEASLVGLPGHVVLGFRTEDGESSFIDVFREGNILSVADCQQICFSYGFPWQPEFLCPLPAPAVFQRCLNNLSNCYFHALANSTEPFQADLFFNQRAIASVHKQPPGVAAILVERLIGEIPLTLQSDLLRFHGLMAPLESQT